jgi:hypothetical protein
MSRATIRIGCPAVRWRKSAKPNKEGNKGPVITLFHVPITLFLKPAVQYAVTRRA